MAEASARTLWGTLILMLVSNMVCAQGTGWYLGGGLGLSRINDSNFCSNLNGVVSTAFSCNPNKTDSGGHVLAGYQFSDNIALEGNLIGVGRFETSNGGAIADEYIIVGRNENSDSDGIISANMIGTWPITGEFGMLGQIGVFRWGVTGVTIINQGGSFTETHKSGYSPDIGVGVKYDFKRARLQVRAELTRFMAIVNPNTGNRFDIDRVSVSVVYFSRK